MRTLLPAIPILAAAAVLQSAFLARLRFLNGAADLVLMIVVAWSLVQRGNAGPVWALVGGVIADSLSGGPPGAITLSLVLVTLAITLTEGRFYRANWPVAMVTSVLSTLLYHLIYLAMLALADHPVDFANTLALVTFPSAILNFLLMFPVYQAAKWLAVLVAPPKVEIG